MPYSKLDCGITKSSIWAEALHVRVVWISFLAEKDENGFVESSRSGMIRICNVTPEQFDEAVSKLESPDPDSRTPDNEGRRISKIEGGWVVLNHEKYRLSTDIQRDKTRERVKRYRERLKNVTDCTDCNVTQALAPVSVSVSVSDINSLNEDKGCGEKGKPSLKELQIPDHLKDVWPFFEEMRKKKRAPLTDKAAELTIRNLERLSSDKQVQVEILEQSIQKGWTGVFPLKENEKKSCSGGITL